MADNRIYLKCTGCGKTLFLGKRFQAGYYWRNYGKENNQLFRQDPKFKDYPLQDERPLEDRLNEFYDQHTWCNGAGLDCFVIEYEISEHS